MPVLHGTQTGIHIHELIKQVCKAVTVNAGIHPLHRPAFPSIEQL